MTDLAHRVWSYDIELLFTDCKEYRGKATVRCTFGSEMLKYETDSKMRRYFGDDVPETPVGALIFGKRCQFLKVNTFAT